MYLHALTNKMVRDTNRLSIEELAEVATSQNNVEYRLNYNTFYQGRIDRSFCGNGPFCSLKQVLINAFSDSSNAMLVLDDPSKDEFIKLLLSLKHIVVTYNKRSKVVTKILRPHI